MTKHTVKCEVIFRFSLALEEDSFDGSEAFDDEGHFDIDAAISITEGQILDGEIQLFDMTDPIVKIKEEKSK